MPTSKINEYSKITWQEVIKYIKEKNLRKDKTLIMPYDFMTKKANVICYSII